MRGPRRTESARNGHAGRPHGSHLVQHWNVQLRCELTDTNTHQVALYVLDWDRQGRAETITVTNYSSGSVLDTRSIPNTNSSSLTYTNTTSTNFGNGTYLIGTFPDT